MPEAKITSLMYHDVVFDNDWDASGFLGAGANPYKISVESFREHLSLIQKHGGAAVTTAHQGTPKDNSTLYITFDDGGKSAVYPIADELENLGWRGHFFMTTDRIDSPGFLTQGDLRELVRRGHVIGSHSASHPTRMAACSRLQLDEEWNKSVAVLRDVLGQDITVASVPGGYYKRHVADAAARAGIRVLFTSEPTTRTHTVQGCLVLGRYTIMRRTSAQTAAALAHNHLLPQLQQATVWKAKKVAKKAGPLYLAVRRRLIGLTDR